MHEPPVSSWVRQWIRRRIDKEVAMTPEERREAGLSLGKFIFKNLNSQPFTTNQEAVEILGIAVMYFHSLLYAMTYPDPKEKP